MKTRSLPQWPGTGSWLLASLVFAHLSLACETPSGTCVGITDGDTIKVLRGGKTLKIRLEGVDCPEYGDDFSARAKKFTANMVLGKVVTLRVKETDRYGRLVARVFIDGQDVSVELVRAGLAWHYKRYSADPALAKAESNARAAGIGIWSLPKPVPPWELKAQRAQTGGGRRR